MRVLSPAIDEISQAALWFESQRAGLGSEFWRLVDELLAEIAQNPPRFGKSEFATPEIDLRFALVRRFNYVIHFVIDADEVQIVSIAHGARTPGYWLRRTSE